MISVFSKSLGTTGVAETTLASDGATAYVNNTLAGSVSGTVTSTSGQNLVGVDMLITKIRSIARAD